MDGSSAAKQKVPMQVEAVSRQIPALRISINHVLSATHAGFLSCSMASNWIQQEIRRTANRQRPNNLP
jgi:hypothetical protein